MSDLATLAEKIAHLHGNEDRFENGARVIAQGGVPSNMVAVINAIDDTMLERQLEIMTGTHIVTLVAAGRRLRGIASVVPPKDKSPRFVNEALSPEDKKMVAAVGALLTDIFAPAPRLTLRSIASDGFGRSGDRGVAAADLARLWQVDMEATPGTPIEQFLTSNGSALEAWLHVRGGEIIATEGDVGALQDILSDQLDDFLSNRGRLSGNADGPQLLSLEGALVDGTSIALAQADDDIVLVAYTTDALSQLHASWQVIFS